MPLLIPVLLVCEICRDTVSALGYVEHGGIVVENAPLGWWIARASGGAGVVYRRRTYCGQPCVPQMSLPYEYDGPNTNAALCVCGEYHKYHDAKTQKCPYNSGTFTPRERS